MIKDNNFAELCFILMHETELYFNVVSLHLNPTPYPNELPQPSLPPQPLLTSTCLSLFNPERS